MTDLTFPGESDYSPSAVYQCRTCGTVYRAAQEQDGDCATCSRRPLDPPLSCDRLLAEWAGHAGMVTALNIDNLQMPPAALYGAARKAGRYALDLLGREAQERGRVSNTCRGYSTARGTLIHCSRDVGMGWICPTCAALEHEANRLRAWQRDQRARADRERGKTYGEAPEGLDPFRGGD